ncbi:HD-GYP domain-containing protein [Brevibacillus ginsengisoli]|uniref:HD-GYP domain-containing protein n=1 Tax=Brevibacillus ginsengisoli TaxID=363854 RepID=UPI003CEBACD0
MLKNNDASRRLADRFIFWLSTLVSLNLVVQCMNDLIESNMKSGKFTIGLAVCALIFWMFYFIHRTHLFSRTFSTHGTAFVCLLLFVFLGFYNPYQTSALGMIFLFYPVMMSLFSDKKLFLGWSMLSYLFLAVFLLHEPNGRQISGLDKQNVMEWGSLVLGSFILGWVILIHFSYVRGIFRQECEERNKNYVFRMLHSLIPIVERKSQTSAKEIEQMAGLIKRIISEFAEEDVQDWEIQLISLVHYVSRIKWPDYVFEKQGKLTSYEYEIVQEHCYMGRDLLGDYPSFKRVIEAISYHHERFDGTGYPFQLKGESIPLLAQVLGIAESYLAMTTPRSYREALMPEEAYKEIKSMEGMGFEQKLVRALGLALHFREPVENDSKVTHLVG